jgi:hypothetical protein
MTGASTYHPDTVRVKQTTLTLATLGVSFGCQGRRGWQGEKCKIAEHRLPPPFISALSSSSRIFLLHPDNLDNPDKRRKRLGFTASG